MNTERINRKGIFIVMVLGSVITSVVSTIMSTALPVIMKDFDIPASQAQMLTSIYSLVSGIMILAMAFVVKKFPTKRLFFISIGLFTAGVLLCAIAMEWFLFAASTTGMNFQRTKAGRRIVRIPFFVSIVLMPRPSLLSNKTLGVPFPVCL